jgi:glycosyltransferase involved in cell wall biosynthesis
MAHPKVKVLFQNMTPFAWAHGGFQTQVEETKLALERRGIEVEWLRWWDEKQTGDLIHHFGTPPVSHLRLAKTQGIPSVVTQLFTATCNRSRLQLTVQGLVTRSLMRLPGGIINQMNWPSYRAADKVVVGLEAECRVLRTVFGVPDALIARVPLGLHPDFLQAKPGLRDQPYLITTGTITDRKRSIELAQMARAAQVPILFVGKPYSATDAYGREFARLVDQRFVLHRDHVADRAQLIDLLRGSRGFVIYSRFENWCLSAHEAAACGLPLLVPDQPWSRERFGSQAHYLYPKSNPGNVARLRAFYEAGVTLPAPAVKLYSWDEAAEKLEACYRSLLT